MDDLISRQAVLSILNSFDVMDGYTDQQTAIRLVEQLPSANGMTFEEIAKLLSDLFDECACNVNGNDEWLPQACKYADTECPHPKEKNGCWMQFLMQGGADMRGEQDD